MIVACLKARFKKLPPRKIVYRDYKNFNKITFLYDLDQNLNTNTFYKHSSFYFLLNIFATSFVNISHFQA